MKTDTCEGCSQPMRWLVMPSGKRNPVDPDPVEDGNIVIDHENADGIEYGHVLTKAEKEAPAELGSPNVFALDGVDRFVSHFATCPERNRFRR